MASVYDLKPAFQNLLRPITKNFARRGISANMVTVAAMVISMLVGVLIYNFPDNRLVIFLIPLWLFVRMAFNAIDGMLAREHNMKSSLGAILNELGDVISDTALYLPMALMSNINPILMIIIVILALISEIAGIVPVQIGGIRHYEGPMGKSDRAFVLGLLALLIGFNWLTATIITGICWIVIILLIVTVLNRSAKALKEVDR
jgi:phosphatidylglycerophosphate synthase